jgi:hypothetical protein
MEVLILPLMVATFYLSQAYNTWYSKKLWKNFNIGMYRGVNLSRERRKECFRHTFILYGILIVITFILPLLF